MKVSDYIIDRLALEGIKDIFVLPGGGAMHLNDALARSENIRAIACHHEQACGIAAEAYGRIGLEGYPDFGVAMVTSGPGATNVLTPVVGAWLESLPVLIISGQAKTSDLVGERKVRQSGVQEVDSTKIVRNVTKYAKCVASSDEIQLTMETAFHLMKTGRKGPVWLEIPLDVQSMEFSPRPFDSLCSFGQCHEKYQKVEMSDILTLLKSSKRPLFIFGHGIRLSGAVGYLEKLIDRLKIPFCLTWPAIDYLPASHKLNMGSPGTVAQRFSNFAVQNSDLLISIGARLDKTVTAYNLSGFARDAQKVIVDIDPSELSDKEHLANTQLIKCDANIFVRELLDIDLNCRYDDWTSQCVSWKDRYSSKPQLSQKDASLSHTRFIQSLSDAIPENQIVVTGSSGLAIEFFYAGFQNKIGQRIIHTSALGAMGYCLPAAIGAAVASGTFVLAIESDGSFQLNLQELATIKAQNLKIAIIVMNNCGYASIRNTQNSYFEGRALASGIDSGLWFPSLEKIMAAYEIPYYKIVSSESLISLLTEKVFAERETVFVEVKLSKTEILQPKCSVVLGSDGKIVSMPLEDMSPLLPLSELKENMPAGVSPNSLLARNE